MNIYPKEIQRLLAPIEYEHFWHIGRRRVILEFTPRRGKMLDIGCGNGSVTAYLQSHGIDIEGREGIDVCNLPQVNEYDTIGLFDVLEHVVNDVEAVAECRDALKSKGYLVLTIPAHGKLWGYQDKYAGHYRRYSKQGITAILNIMNFEIERVSYFNMFALPLTFIAKRLKQSGKPLELNVVPFINGLLLAFMELETFILRYGNLPFGSSIIIRARKRE